jgi:hypothetical protein
LIHAVTSKEEVEVPVISVGETWPTFDVGRTASGKKIQACPANL